MQEVKLLKIAKEGCVEDFTGTVWPTFRIGQHAYVNLEALDKTTHALFEAYGQRRLIPLSPEWEKRMGQAREMLETMQEEHDKQMKGER